MNAPALLAVDVASAAVFFVLAAVAARHRGKPGAIPALGLWLACTGLCGVVALSRAGVLGPERAVYGTVLGWIVAVPLWAAFAFAHTGRGPALTRRRIAAMVAYVAVLGATVVGVGPGGLLGQLLRVATSLLQTALVGAGLFGAFLLVRAAVTYDDLPTGQAVSLSIGGLCVSLFMFSLTAQSVADAVPESVTGIAGLTAVAFGVAVLRYRPFEDVPGTGPLARASVIESMSEAVVVVDREGRIVDANAAAERSLGVTVARDAGRPAATVLGYDLDAVAGETTVPTPDGRRTVAVSRSALTDRRGEAVGTSYLFRDVTDRRTRQQRLEVLDRVLRHNLRSDLDAVRGFAEALSDGVVESPEDVAARIEGTASDLVDVGETVERADRLVRRETLAVESVDLAALAEAVAADLSESYDCQIAVAPEAGPTIRTDRAILRTALREVVENAVEHSEASPATARIEATETATGARIAVSDDGPGIPERERAVLLEGEETPLRHGRGVGLWFVSWAVTRLGGALDFAEEAAGSTVRIEVPDRGSGAE